MPKNKVVTPSYIISRMPKGEHVLRDLAALPSNLEALHLDFRRNNLIILEVSGIDQHLLMGNKED